MRTHLLGLFGSLALLSASPAFALCGDGLIDAADGETCDDNNTTNNDGCDALCSVEGGFSCAGSPSVCTAICGDGLLNAGEACDDGNTANNDGCADNCSIDEGFACSGEPSACATVCGDGIISSNEACDDANNDDTDACTNACQLAVCGDGSLRRGLSPEDPAFEECDDGNLDADDACDAACRIPRCGDGVLQGAELCDDGNLTNEDGCSNICEVEPRGGCSTQERAPFSGGLWALLGGFAFAFWRVRRRA
jgi:MYXO-CTERM domain-containing protein